MEKELRIVISIFLVYLIFGLTQLVQTGDLITPVFLTPFIYPGVALVFLILNAKSEQKAILIFMLFAMISLALANEYFLQIAVKKWSTEFYLFVTTDAFVITEILVFFLFLLFAVWRLYKVGEIGWPAFGLLIPLIGSVLMSFYEKYVIQEVCIQFFYLLFFYFGQRGNSLKSKTLRVVSYQFLLISLLEGFEYFI